MKKKIIITSVCSILFALMLYTGISFNRNLEPALKLSKEFSTYNNLVEKSPIVITGSVTTDNNEFTYEEMTFAITEVKISEAIRGAESLQTLNILQTKSDEDPYLAKGKEVLLFLSKYEGPIADNVYVINGLYKGQYEIKDDSIYGVGTAEKLQFPSSKLKTVISEIKNTEFKHEKELEKPSAEAVENENNNEKQMKEQLDKESQDKNDNAAE